jgi:hypothetical protein
MSVTHNNNKKNPVLLKPNCKNKKNPQKPITQPHTPGYAVIATFSGREDLREEEKI